MMVLTLLPINDLCCCLQIEHACEINLYFHGLEIISVAVSFIKVGLKWKIE